MERVNAPLYVPFRAVQGHIDSEKVNALARVYRVRPELAASLKGHEIREPGDLLRINEFATRAHVSERSFLWNARLTPQEILGLTELSLALRHRVG